MRLRSIAILCAGLIVIDQSAHAITAKDIRPNYESIVSRNPFGLKPIPPPPEKPKPPEAPAAKQEIFLTGITSIGYPRNPKRAYIVTKEQGKNAPSFYSLREEEGRDGIEVLNINEKNKTVKVKYRGEEVLLSFKTHGMPASAGPAPAMPGAPGGMPGKPGVPNQPGHMPAMTAFPTPAYNAAPANTMNTPQVNAQPYNAPNSAILSRPIRTRGAADSATGPGGALNGPTILPPGATPPPPPQQQVDVAEQYLRLKLDEAANRKQGIPTPPIPDL